MGVMLSNFKKKIRKKVNFALGQISQISFFNTPAAPQQKFPRHHSFAPTSEEREDSV